MIRALGYYLSRTFINQVKKLFKTWFLIFILACCLFGGLIGLAVGSLTEHGESVSSQSQIEEMEEGEAEQGTLTDKGDNSDSETKRQGIEGKDSEDTGAFLSAFQGLERKEIVEAGLSLLTLILFFYAVLSADRNGSSIFLPADAALLFPAPWRPQSVLMFRLICRMGMYFFIAVIMILDLPALNDGLKLSAAGTVLLLPAWFLFLFYDQLLTTLCYTWAASAPGRKKILRGIVYALLLLVAVAYLAWLRSEGGSPLQAGIHFLSAPAGRWIPAWGWLRGMVFYAEEGKAGPAFLCGGLLVLGCVILLFVIRRLNADFYEDAMARSEETAAIQEQAREGRITLRKRDKKDRSDKLKRDGLNYGSGASIFFWKEIYNRSRFARFSIFNKTSETFLVTALAASVIGLRTLPDLAVYFPFLTLAAFVFFRSLGNPLEKDLATGYFFLTPEPTWKKLLCSELGGLSVTLLDLLPAFALGAILTRMQPAFFLGALVFTLTLSYYCMNTGAFLNATLPADAGVPVKQLVQIMFVYFGLLPDIGLIAAGFSGKFEALSVSRGILLAGLVNILIGSLFFFMIPAFLDPVPGRIPYPIEEPSAEETRMAKKSISYAGFACLLLFALGSLLQFGSGMLYPIITGREEMSETAFWLLNFLPLYAAAFPLAIYLLKKPGRRTRERTTFQKESEVPQVKMRMTLPRFLAFFAATVCLMYAGNAAGNLINLALGKLTGFSSTDAVQVLAGMDSMVWKLIFPVLIGPMFEELFFRKALIDYLSPYGERFALIFSALSFGLFHGNLVQFLYAFLIGLVFAYIYLRTGQIRWTMLLHILVNFMGIILAAKFVEDLDPIKPAAVIYLVLLLFCALAGMAVLITKVQTCFFLKQEKELPGDLARRLTWRAPGWLAFLILMICVMIFSFVQI